MQMQYNIYLNVGADHHRHFVISFNGWQMLYMHIGIEFSYPNVRSHIIVKDLELI